MERKIGEIFEHNGEWYQCIRNLTCTNCGFNNKGCLADRHITGDCSGRLDGASVIFKKLDKIGEPYKLGEVLIQQYQGIAPVVLPKDSECSSIFRVISSINVIEIEIKQNKENMEEKKLNLRPFDLEAAKAGKPVCTRDGRKARIICFDYKENRPIIAIVSDKFGEKEILTYANKGELISNKINSGDLMMLPEKKEGWVNVYREESNNNERLIEQTIYKTRKDAFDKACPQGYITTTKINWEE